MYFSKSPWAPLNYLETCVDYVMDKILITRSVENQADRGNVSVIYVKGVGHNGKTLGVHLLDREHFPSTFFRRTGPLLKT